MIGNSPNQYSTISFTPISKQQAELFHQAAFMRFDSLGNFSRRFNWRILIKGTSKGDLIPDLRFALVDPAVWTVRQHFTLEILIDVLIQGNILGIALRRVWDGIAFAQNGFTALIQLAGFQR